MGHFTYWWKWIISYIYVTFFKRSIKSRFDSYDMDAKGDPYATGFLPFPEEITLESPLPESQLIHTLDEVFFYGVNSKSEYLITRITRSTNQEAEAWIYLKLSDGKIYQLPETSGFQQSTSDKRIFSCGGLQIHYLSPMRRWRIFYNGLLMETDEEGVPSGKKVHVKFALIWRASTNAFDFRSRVNSKSLASGLANAEWNQHTPPLKKLFDALDFYAQGGIIMGTVKIDENDEMNMYLFGEKLRFLGDISALKGINFFHILGHISQNGRFTHVIEISLPNIVKRLRFGFTTILTGFFRPILDKECILERFSGAGADIKAEFHSGDKLFRLSGTLTGNQNSIQSTGNSNGGFTIQCLDFDLNSLPTKETKSLTDHKWKSQSKRETGKGIVIEGKIMKLSRKMIPDISSWSDESENSQASPLVSCFSEKICQNPEITGGKGSSLGKLSELSKEHQSKFLVPKGFVVTTSSYELFVTAKVLSEIRNLENVLYQDKVDETKIACQRLMDEVIKTTIPDPIRHAIVTNIEKVFSDNKDAKKFAVRSSATGEDTEQMSAAGQMETYLGVSDVDEIMVSIKKCWASQFSYIAVQYKRQNGQVINTPMAVVVQEMISCDVAGVLFTCDPLTGNPTSMSITANYGLGESVVSGSEEPDTIEIERLEEDNLTIKHKTIGSKSHKIVLKDEGGTIAEDVTDDEKNSCCLSDNDTLKLGKIALAIEMSFGSHRDIEWGVWNKKLYIFQSRPITNCAGETDFEIDHEYDAPMRCESEYFAMSNVGEVFPGATSPLSLDITMKYFKTVFQSTRFFAYNPGELPKYFSRGIVSMYRHVILTCIDLFRYASDSPARAQVNALAYFGRVVDEKCLLELAKERYTDGLPKFFNLKMYLKIIYRTLYGARASLKKVNNTYKGYFVPSIRYDDSQELFNHLVTCFSDLTMAIGYHMVQTECSSFLNMMIFIILQKAAGEINTDVYNALAKLLKCHEVESADVPKAIEKLALAISEEMKAENFKKMNPKEALEWLETSTTTAGEKYREFFKKHGHRCLRELDMFSIAWDSDPLHLVKLLQKLAGSVKEKSSKKTKNDVEEMISGLNLPMTSNSKWLLKIILPLSHKAVQNRECSKSIFIRVVNEWRKAFRKLAKLMVLEGRIPDEDLLFFMDLEEVKELLETRSPRIISKANHRRRRQPIIDRYIFPELSKGFPKPVNLKKKITVHSNDNFSMKGIPVSQGEVTGIVRVALDLEEASLLQPGEILVTYSTDIGWSPYFPILGGVATELGGLISHGAVVSREYGIPCIAGLHGASNNFKTGDFVLLDGNKGILQKLPKPNDS